ncbi:zf-UBP-domain-containing protein [Hesseltinella vesiculosa]|uniref:Zf-UBP-domain-containing protein n=1 Tax=Hesseltinella vesiculosa TaxID=101127 RepID=A0A1X2G842_9FUNG|nr:zf-UBP-domain-containing protein [Hesseltinella vesiculosa]
MATTKGPPVGLVSILPNTFPQQAILHVYRSLEDLHLDDQQRGNLKFLDEPTQQRATTLCAMAIPSYVSMADFLQFVAPVDPFVSHYRVIRDATPHTYMILMTFRDSDTALEFYKQYDHQKFSSLEDDECLVAYVTSIGVQDSLVSPLSFPFNTQPDIADDPHCPVCLEPLDGAATGLFTISCQHTFHVHCISQWGDNSNGNQQPASSSTTPSKLSLFTVIPHEESANQCQGCDLTTQLWLCLVCGHIGCGRQEQGHALAHYQATNHIYALEIDSKRVWDYAGDGYVHRLVQNAVDGKLVELPGQEDTPNEAGKLDAMAVEYSYLLTSQLDSQRMYYEDRIKQVVQDISDLSLDCDEKSSRLALLQQTRLVQDRERTSLSQAIQSHEKENAKLKQKVTSWKDKTKAIENKYLEEDEMSASLVRNNAIAQQLIDRIQEQIAVKAQHCQELMAKLAAQDTTQDTSPST